MGLEVHVVALMLPTGVPFRVAVVPKPVVYRPVKPVFVMNVGAGA